RPRWRRNKPPARHRWSEHRRGSWSAHRESGPTANRRPASARSAESTRRPGRQVPSSRRIRPAMSARSETETTPSASTARYGWLSPSRRRRETCRMHPVPPDRRNEAASHFTLNGRRPVHAAPGQHLLLLDKNPDHWGPTASRKMADPAAPCYVAIMSSFLSMLILPIAVGAVAFVLLLGLINMMRGGSPNLSQKLMQWRVLLQFIAIVLAMLTVWAMGH